MLVYGLFETRAALETAVGRLKAEGFSSSDISILLPTFEGSKEFVNMDSGLGGALSWLAGVGTLVIPGIGPFVTAGPILATLGGVGIVDALIGMGMPEYEALHFARLVADGGMLVSVHSGKDEWDDKAIVILQNCGAHDISSASIDKNVRSSHVSRVSTNKFSF